MSAADGGSARTGLHKLAPLPLSSLVTALSALTQQQQQSQRLIGLSLAGALSLVDGPAKDFSGNGGGGAVLLERPRAFSLLCSALTAAPTGASAIAHSWLSLLRPLFTAPPAGLLADGHGRLLLLLADLLRRAHADSVSAGAAFSPLAPLFVSPPPGLTAMSAEEACACRRLLRTCRRLAQRGGVTFSFGDATGESAAASGGEDWLCAVSRIVADELAASGDLFPLDTQAESLVRGVAHTLLSTEVEGAALEALERVFVEYLFSPVPLSPAGAASAGREERQSDEEAEEARLEEARARLSRLLQTPHRVFQCAPPSLCCRGLGVGGTSSPFTAATRSDDAVPAWEGAVNFSQVIPSHVVTLALEDDAQLGSDGAVSDQPRWWSLPAPSAGTSTAAAAPVLPASEGVRALLLRIDPAGDWLPPEEDSYNTQTFFNFYENDLSEQQQQRQSDRRGRRACDDDDSDEEMFEDIMHRATGTRKILPATAVTVVDCSAATGEAGCDGEGDERALNFLVQTAAAGCDSASSDARLLKAALRLFLFAVRRGVDLILTPEKAPPILRTVGRRYVPILRNLVNKAAAQTPAGEARDGTMPAPASTGIRVVDCIRVQDFLYLQSTSAVPSSWSPRGEGADSGAYPRQPLLLCRDCLRAPSTSVFPRTGVAADEADEAPFLSLRSAVCAPSCLLARRPLASVKKLDDVLPDRLASTSLRSLGGYRACLLLFLSASCLCTTPPPLQQPHPTLLLATPNATLAERYAHLLLKCARSVSRVLPSSPSLPSLPLPGGTVVRAGGAAFVAASRALRRLVSHLQHQPRTTATIGQEVADRTVVGAVLLQLAEACLSIPRALAEGVMNLEIADAPLPTRSSLPVGFSGKGGETEAAAVQGPRARRRLWGLALRAAALPTADVAGGERTRGPELHVYVPSVADLARDIVEKSGSAPLFSSCLCSSSPTSDLAALSRNGVASTTMPCVYSSLARRVFTVDRFRGASNRPPFVESLEENLALLRVAMRALYMVLAAAVGD